MLELRPTCERCDTPLPEESPDARICSFECTFCAECTDTALGGVCPNCGGELVARPTRGGPERPGVAVRRYLDCWQRGDLDGLIDCYADAFTLHYSGSSRFAGTHAGREAALGVMAEVSTLAPRALRSVDDILVGRDGAALLVTEQLTREGETAEIQRLFRYRVEDALLVECWLHETDQGLVDHYWR